MERVDAPDELRDVAAMTDPRPPLAARALKAMRGLARRHDLGDDAVERLTAVAHHLARDDAPSTVSSLVDVVDRHLADALTVLDVPALAAASSFADLGSGAGVPALPVACVRPDLEVLAVEATGKKCRFIEAGVEVAGLTRVKVIHARAEGWPAGIGRCDVVGARAVAPLAVLLEYAAPLLRVGGAFVGWKAAVEASEAADARFAADALGFAPSVVLDVGAGSHAAVRTLWTYEKVSATPDRFPRREGMATKRPLRATSGT